jgi:hypothetical protein
MVADPMQKPVAQLREQDSSRADEWESVVDALYRDALAVEELDADAVGAEWVVTLEDWERWARIERFGSPSLLMLTSEL